MDIITMARELGKLIQQDERYKRIDAAKKANDEDEKLQELIAKFNLKRSELSVEMSQENKNPEKLNQLDKELKALYQEVMANPNMAEFNAAKAEVDGMMNSSAPSSTVRSTVRTLTPSRCRQAAAETAAAARAVTNRKTTAKSASILRVLADPVYKNKPIGCCTERTGAVLCV